MNSVKLVPATGVGSQDFSGKMTFISSYSVAIKFVHWLIETGPAGQMSAGRAMLFNGE